MKGVSRSTESLQMNPMLAALALCAMRLKLIVPERNMRLRLKQEKPPVAEIAVNCEELAA